MSNKLFTMNATTLSLLMSKNAKTALNFSFKASGKTLTIHEPDFKRVLYVVNLTSERIMYNPLKQPLPMVEGNRVSLNYEYTDMSDFDDILVIYEAYEQDNSLSLLEAIYEQLDRQTKILEKIYR